jgi:ribosomal protein L11 methyltransferase
MMNPRTVYLWRKRVESRKAGEFERKLLKRAAPGLAVITQPGYKRILFEIVLRTRNDARALVNELGGRIEKLSTDWFGQFAQSRKRQPIRIGQALLIINERLRSPKVTRKPLLLSIPAGTAFGTGDHPTTAMALRLLERVIRPCSARSGTVRPPQLVVDLGTGSGILALAAKLLGAKAVIGIDLDPVAISTAKENARTNRIGGVQFEVADVQSWVFPRKADIITANLFSGLLIQILPKLRRSRWLILSGILRREEADVVRALRRTQVNIVRVRRRGKWIAILGTNQ